MSTSTKSARVVISTPLPPAGKDLLGEKAAKHNWEVIYRKDDITMTRNEIFEAISSGIDGLLCGTGNTVDSEVLERAGKQLKVVSTNSVGYDHVDASYLKQYGIQLGHTPDVLTDATADFTVGLVLAACRRLGEAIKAVKTGQWTNWGVRWMPGMELRGKTLGVLGMGRIGLATAKRLKAFGMNRVIYYGRAPRSDASEVNGEFVNLDQLLEQSDILCICCSLNEHTRHILGYEQFCRMKPTSVVVNTARGGVIEQDGLVRALQERKISAAGLDVTTPEPLPVNHPLLSLDNCIVSPHIGSDSREAVDTMAILAVENLCAGIVGESLPASVTL